MSSIRRTVTLIDSIFVSETVSRWPVMKGGVMIAMIVYIAIYCASVEAAAGGRVVTVDLSGGRRAHAKEDLTSIEHLSR